MANDNEKNTLTQDYVKGLITDYDFVRSHIITALISKERKENEERLTGPHTTVCGDIVMGYRILLEKSSVYITGQLDRFYENLWGRDKTYLLYGQAEINTALMPEAFGPMLPTIAKLENKEVWEILHISEALYKEFLEEAESDIMVVTNSLMTYGAIKVLYSQNVKDFAKEHGGCYVIPSSIHECLLIGKDHADETGCMTDGDEMIREVNRREVRPEEVLSDHLFFMDENGNLLFVK